MRRSARSGPTCAFRASHQRCHHCDNETGRCAAANKHGPKHEKPNRVLPALPRAIQRRFVIFPAGPFLSSVLFAKIKSAALLGGAWRRRVRESRGKEEGNAQAECALLVFHTLCCVVAAVTLAREKCHRARATGDTLHSQDDQFDGQSVISHFHDDRTPSARVFQTLHTRLREQTLRSPKYKRI